MGERGSEARRLFQEVYRSALSRVVALAGGEADETARVARQTLRIVAAARGLRGELRADLRSLLAAPGPRPSAWRALSRRVAVAPSAVAPGDLGDRIVHDYAFATVGARDGRGDFRLRGRFFALPQEALRTYHDLDRAYLAGLVRSLGLAR